MKRQQNQDNLLSKTAKTFSTIIPGSVGTLTASSRMVGEVALEWIDMVHAVLTQMVCPNDLWVRVATGAMQNMGKLG